MTSLKAFRLSSILSGICLLLATGLPLAQEEETAAGAAAGVSVAQAAIARDVQDREPVEASTAFPADVGQLVCYTRVEGAGEGMTLVHVWLRGDEEMARVELPVRGSPWRTWSKKRILPSWTGTWTVRIEDGEGNALSSVDFTVGQDG